jgi:hypothetical protein
MPEAGPGVWLGNAAQLGELDRYLVALAIPGLWARPMGQPIDRSVIPNVPRRGINPDHNKPIGLGRVHIDSITRDGADPLDLDAAAAPIEAIESWVARPGVLLHAVPAHLDDKLGKRPWARSAIDPQSAHKTVPLAGAGAGVTDSWMSPGRPVLADLGLPCLPADGFRVRASFITCRLYNK